MDIDFDWVKDIQPMEPGMEFLKDNFDNLVEVIKGDRMYYVDSERKPLFYYKQDSENGFVWVSNSRIWSVLSKDFGLNYGEIENLIKVWLGETYNLRGFTPILVLFLGNFRLGETNNLRGLPQ